MNLDKEFVPYEAALALRELGFDEPCFYRYNHHGTAEPDIKRDGKLVNNRKWEKFGDYDDCVGAPLYQQAFRWFREKCNLYPMINLHDSEDIKTWRLTISILGYYELAYNQNIGKEPYYNSYEEAELASLIRLIEIVKERL